MALQLRESAATDESWTLKVVRDRLSLQLVLKRHRPDVMVVSMDTDAGCRAVGEILQMRAVDPSQVAWVALGTEGAQAGGPSIEWSARLPRPYSASQLLETLDQVQQQEPVCA